MAIKSSGNPNPPLAFSEIETEFGSNSSRSLGDYRISQTVGDLTKTLDTGIPSSGPIKFSEFYGKRLNVVVDFHTGDAESRQNAKSRYNGNSGVTVIGGFRDKKQAGSKILIHVNKTIGSAKGNQNYVALRTGSWNSDVVLSVDIGGSGRLYGAGGDGGAGADSRSDETSKNPSGGGNGTSALGIEHEETAVNISGGRIRCGFAGGGGGAGARQVDGPDRSACGGGGGGGAGFPAGNGGERGLRLVGDSTSTESTDEVAVGSSGGAGQLEENGEGGEGGNNDGEAKGGDGGRGGDPNESAQSGNGGKNLDSSQGGAGANGAAIRRSNGSIQVDVSNGGTISGNTSATGVA